MSWPADGTALADVLDPVLNVTNDNDTKLTQAVTDVAESLAAMGVLIVDRAGQPVHGVTDERAVIGALATYARGLAQAGRLDDAVEVGQLMDRVDRLRYQPRPRRIA